MKGQAVDRVHCFDIADAPGRESAEYSRLGGVRVNDVGPELTKVLFDLEITYGITKRTYRAYEFIDNDCFIFLIFCLLEQPALRTDRRPGNERNIMAALSQQLAGYQSILLRPA